MEQSAQRAAIAKKNRARRRRNDTVSAYLFLSPCILVYLVFVLAPIFIVIFLTFNKYNVITPPQWNEYKNFIRVPLDARILVTLKNSFKYVILICPMHIVFSILLALGVNTVKNQVAVYSLRTILYFPTLLAVSSVALAWKYIFSTNFGILNYALSFFGVDPIPWLNSSDWPYLASMIFSLWKNVGVYFLYIYIGLQGVDKSVLEAASIDGATGNKQFFHITLPMISPTLFFVTITMLIGCIQIFDEPYILTQGGPGDATRSFSQYIYQSAFVSQNYGYASVLALIMFVIVLAITLIQFKCSGWVQYDRD